MRFRSIFPTREEKSLRLPDGLSLITGSGTAAGKSVGPETALRCPAVLACVRSISEAVGQLPLRLYQTKGGSKTKAGGHPLYDLLRNQPNDWTSSFEFRMQMTAALLLHGNAYSFINWSGGVVTEIYQLPNGAVAVEHDAATMEPSYRVTLADGSTSVYGRDTILHLRLLGHDWSATGLSPVAQCKEAVGLALALEEHGARLFSNGARPSGVFKHPGRLAKEVFDRLKISFQNTYAGGENSGKTAILEEGMTFEPFQFSSVDAQFLEMRKFQVEEIARAFRIPLHKIGELSRSTNNNIEQQSLEFVTDCLMPILRLWQGAIRISCLSPEERKNYFVEFELDDMLRADTSARFTAYQAGILNGILSPNECRDKESLPPYSGGDQFRLPLNTADASGQGAPKGRFKPGEPPKGVANA